MEGHAGDQRLDFLTGYRTLYVLMSWTMFSKILELVNMLQSSKSTCKSRRHSYTEYQRDNHWLHQALQPPLQFPKSPLPPTAVHTPTAPTNGTPGPGGWVWESSQLALFFLLQNWVFLLTGPPVLQAHPCPQFFALADTASFSCLRPPSLSVPLGVWTLKIFSILKNFSQLTSSLYYPGLSYSCGYYMTGSQWLFFAKKEWRTDE